MLGTTSVALWVTHNNDFIGIPSVPPPLLIRVSNEGVKGMDYITPPEARGEDSDRRWRYIITEETIYVIDELSKKGKGVVQRFFMGDRCGQGP